MIKFYTHIKYSGLAILFVCINMLISCHSSSKAYGVEEGWDLLGSDKVAFVSDRAVIQVNNNTFYTGIRFRVEDRDVHITSLKIFFRNGDKLEPAIDENVSANQESRLIQLDSDGRPVDRIEFRYRTVGNILRGRATILVFGHRSDRK